MRNRRMELMIAGFSYPLVHVLSLGVDDEPGGLPASMVKAT